VILAAAAGAVGGELSRRHGDKQTGRALDDFHVADHKSSVQRDAAHGLEPVVGLFDQFDSYVADFHYHSSTGYM
jgi:hypothetical protein